MASYQHLLNQEEKHDSKLPRNEYITIIYNMQTVEF